MLSAIQMLFGKHGHLSMPSLSNQRFTHSWNFAALCGAIASVIVSVWYLVDSIVLSPFVEFYAEGGGISWQHIRRLCLEISLPVFVGVFLVAAMFGKRVRPEGETVADNQPSGSEPGLQRLSCPVCGNSFLYDGSAAGTGFKCPDCQNEVPIPGTRTRNEITEQDYHFTLFGNHPVQAEGRVLGHPFFFRAKYDFWDFTVVTSHECMAQASHCDAPEMAHGYFMVIDEGEPEGHIEWQGYWLDGRYGSGTDAGNMDQVTASEIIEDCLKAFIDEERHPGPKCPTITKI